MNDARLERLRVDPFYREAVITDLDALADLNAGMREALREALDCKGAYEGTVSERGGYPALCARCAEHARAVLAGEGGPAAEEAS